MVDDLTGRLRETMLQYLRGILSSDDVESDLNDAADRIADLERQIAELRAEPDSTNLQTDGWANAFVKERGQREAAEAENAQLKALPLKDEVERVAEGLSVYAASLRGQHSTRNEIADELDRMADALLSRLRAAEQEGWRLVPLAALEWLNGEGPDADGYWFGDAPDDGKRGAFWWRSKFNAILPAAPSEHGGWRG